MVLLSLHATADATLELMIQPSIRLSIVTGSTTVTLVPELSVGLSIITGSTTVAIAPEVGLLIRTGPLSVATAFETQIAIGIITGPTRPVANAAAVRLTTGPLNVSMSVAGAARVRTGPLNVSVTVTGNPFQFTRNLVIAGDDNLFDETLTEPILLGIILFDPAFRSVDNGGRISQPFAGDIEFTTSDGATVLPHNEVGFDPVNGVINVDIRLPTWDLSSDYRIRMNYGSPTASEFVRVAPLIGLTRTGSQLLRPTPAQLGNTLPGNIAGNVDDNQNFASISGFTTTNNLTLDLRGRRFYHHSLNSFTGDGNRPGQNSPVRPNGFNAGLSIYGAEIIGEQADNTVWSTMKTDNPAAMDDNGILFPNPSVPAAATVYIEACVFRKQFDGINTDPRYGTTISNKGHYIVRGCYGEKSRDEFIENDSCQYMEVYDCLIDSCHNFLSMRPGGSSSAVPPDYSDSDNWVKCYNVLARCRGQYYDQLLGGDSFDFGNKRDPQFGVAGSVFVSNPNTYGPGYVHREPFKGDGVETFTNFNCTIWIDCRDSIFAIESRPTSGPVVFPPGTYDNVYLLVLFDVPTQGLNLDDFVDSDYVQARGITVLTGAAALAMWDTERTNWITAHGGFTDTDGLLRFPFHAAPA